MKKILYYLLTTIILFANAGCSKKEPEYSFIKSITINNLPEEYKHNFGIVFFSIDLNQYNDHSNDNSNDDNDNDNDNNESYHYMFNAEQNYEVQNCPTSITYDVATKMDIKSDLHVNFEIYTNVGGGFVVRENFKINSDLYADYPDEIAVISDEGFEYVVRFKYNY